MYNHAGMEFLLTSKWIDSRGNFDRQYITLSCISLPVRDQISIATSLLCNRLFSGHLGYLSVLPLIYNKDQESHPQVELFKGDNS